MQTAAHFCICQTGVAERPGKRNFEQEIRKVYEKPIDTWTTSPVAAYYIRFEGPLFASRLDDKL